MMKIFPSVDMLVYLAVYHELYNTMFFNHKGLISFIFLANGTQLIKYPRSNIKEIQR